MRLVATVAVFVTALAVAPRADASLGGPSAEQFVGQALITGVHAVSLGVVTFGNALSRRPWRAASYVVGGLNLALSVGAVALAGQSGGCCMQSHQATVLVLEGLAVGWACALVVWAIVAPQESLPRATVAVVPTPGGATAGLVLVL